MPHFQNQDHDTRTMRIHDDQLDVLVALLKSIHVLAIKQLESIGLDPDGQPLARASEPVASAGFENPPSTEQH